MDLFLKVFSSLVSTKYMQTLKEKLEFTRNHFPDIQQKLAHEY